MRRRRTGNEALYTRVVESRRNRKDYEWLDREDQDQSAEERENHRALKDILNGSE